MSLIEMIVAIVVVGVAVPALTKNWVDVSVRSSKTEALADAGFYGGQMMEEITAKRYDEELNPPWTPKAQFGTGRSDENDETGWAAFDDVDDFDGYTNTTPDGFTRAVLVDYMSLNGAAWETAGTESDFKRIEVRVSKPRLGVGNVTMTTIVGRY
jgi:type II secretory pathway pseudopilin PulG